MEMTPNLDDLRSAVARGLRSLAEVIELAAASWERPSASKPGEFETWTPRQTTEHVIRAHFAFARAVAETINHPPPPETVLDFTTPSAALVSLATADAAASPILEAVTPEQLALETPQGDDLAALLTLMGNHVRGHARQVLGLDASQQAR